MSDEQNKVSPNDTSKPIQIDLKSQIDLLNTLSEETNFQIFILLLIYKEQSLTELDQKISKSRATIHRHLQDLLDAELIYISRQEIIRGPIPANYYQTNFSKLMHLSQINTMKFEDMTPNEKLQFRKALIQTNLTTCRLIQNNLHILEQVLISLDPHDEALFTKMFNLTSSPTFLSFALMTDGQKELFMKDFLTFNQEFARKIQDQGLLGLEEEKPHVNFMGFLPMQLLFSENLVKKSSKDELID